MKKLLMATACAVAMMGSVPANAAQIWVNPAEGHGHVIHIKGEIEKGDANRFANAVGKAGVRPGDATVWLDSPGGLVYDGMLIARAIKKYEWSTYVAADTRCVSMCANIWLAGHTRFVNEHAKVGFHSLSDTRIPNKRDDQLNTYFLGFYREMGLSDKAGRVLLAAEPGSDAIWMNGDLAETLNIKSVVILSQENEKDHTQPVPETNKVAVAPALNQESKDEGPPPVKAEDVLPKQEQPERVAEPRRRVEPRHVERPHRRRYASVPASGYGGRECAFSVPVPYIGGITIRGRC
jgi:hypothetical protein